jgi:hypothetical protein
MHARFRRRVAAPAVAALSALALTAGAVLAGQAASAVLIDVPPTGDPGRLVLSSEPYPAQFLELSPGDPAYWQVGARLEDAERATLSLELRKDGALVEHPRGLVMTVAVCDDPWTRLDATPACASGARAVTVATPADDYTSASPSFELRPLTASAPEFLLVTLAVEDSAAAAADESLMGLTGTMGVGLTATAVDDVPVTPGRPSLPATGADFSALWAAAALAAGLLGAGWALRLARKGETA